MELDGTRTALPELIACPEPGCEVPAGVVDRFALASTDGPVELVRTRCLEGHGFTQRVDALAAWPVTQAAGATPVALPAELERLRDFHLPPG